MKRVGIDDITANQFRVMIVGSMIGVGILTLPSDVVEVSMQDGWISTLLGTIYPLTILFLANLLYKRHPDEDILTLSKRFYGKVLGSVLNFIFMLEFLFFLITRTSGLVSVVRVYIADYLTPFKVMLVVCFVGATASSRGLKILGRLNEIIFYMLIILVLIPGFVLKDGNILNVRPIFGSGIKNILMGSTKSIFAYFGSEMIFLIYPHLTDKSKMKKSALSAVAIITFIYTWFVFAMIFYIGIDIIPKYSWPFVTSTEALKLPFLNNFRYIFMFLWTMVILKTISNYNFAFIYSLGSLRSGKDYKKLGLWMLPVVIFLSMYFSDENLRRSMVRKYIPMFVAYNFVFVIVLLLIIYFKEGIKNEK